MVLPLLLLAACRESVPAPTPVVAGVLQEAPTAVKETPLSMPTATAAPTPAQTAVPTSTPPRTSAPATAPSPTLPVLPTETAVPPLATPDPYAAYTIEALSARAYGGGQIALGDRLEVNDRFARYAISYPSDGLAIHGFMNVPHEGTKFPVAIVLHGYIDPDQYTTLDYTTRYADHLAAAGYLVLHPNLRGFPPRTRAMTPFARGWPSTC